MENATKALIIAAAILIAIVLISLGVFVLGQGTEMVKENSDMTPEEVTAFNNKFNIYFGKRVSASKVKQLVKVVNQHNRNTTESEKIELKSVDYETGHRVLFKDSADDIDYTDKYVTAKETYYVYVKDEDYTANGRIKAITVLTTTN